MKSGIRSGSDISDASTTPPYSSIDRHANSCTLKSSLLACELLIHRVETRISTSKSQISQAK